MDLNADVKKLNRKIAIEMIKLVCRIVHVAWVIWVTYTLINL